MRSLLTLSGLQLDDVCPSAHVLPRIGNTSVKADIGSALHEVNAARGEGHEPDLDDVADRWNLNGKDRARFFGRARAMDLQIPDGALYELPLCLRADGTVEPVEGGRGSYEVPDDAIVAGTLDIVFATPTPLVDGRWCDAESVLWTPDLKTGKDAYVAPIAYNWQARVSALLGARWTDANVAVPAIVYPDEEGGRWDVPMRGGRPVPLRARDIDQIEADVRDLHSRVMEQAKRYLEGKPLKMVTGAHCTYCPARAGCPGHIAEARALATGQAGLAAGPLTHEQAVRGAGMLGPVRKAADALEEALQAYVEIHGPIELPDGRMYGPQPSEKQVFATRATYQAIVEELAPVVGPEMAAECADLAFTTGEKWIYNAIRPAHEAAGFKKKMKAAFERIAAQPGVMSTVPTEKWSVHYPKALPEGDEA